MTFRTLLDCAVQRTLDASFSCNLLVAYVWMSNIAVSSLSRPLLMLDIVELAISSSLRMPNGADDTPTWSSNWRPETRLLVFSKTIEMLFCDHLPAHILHKIVGSSANGGNSCCRELEL